MSALGIVTRLPSCNLRPSRISTRIEDCRIDAMSEEHRTQFEREHGISSILETLGGTGVTQIFVHDITAVGDRTELATSFPGFDKYAERALLAARPDDLVCVSAEVDGQYHQFLA